MRGRLAGQEEISVHSLPKRAKTTCCSEKSLVPDIFIIFFSFSCIHSTNAFRVHYYVQGIGFIAMGVIRLGVAFLEGLIVVQVKDNIPDNHRRMNISGCRLMTIQRKRSRASHVTCQSQLDYFSLRSLNISFTELF